MNMYACFVGIIKFRCPVAHIKLRLQHVRPSADVKKKRRIFNSGTGWNMEFVKIPLTSALALDSSFVTQQFNFLQACLVIGEWFRTSLKIFDDKFYIFTT